MKFSKSLTINVGDFQSLRLLVEDAPSFEACDELLIAELERLSLPVNSKVHQMLNWQRGVEPWM